MKCRVFFMLGICLFLIRAVPEARAEPCGELRENFRPQETPEGTYRQELELLKRGEYCYDLEIYDAKWRRRGDQILRSGFYRSTYDRFNKPFKVHSDGGHAVVYYPKDKKLGPACLYKDGQGWILDRTQVMGAIRYGQGEKWYAVDGSYPCLRVLRQAMKLRRGQSARGDVIYQPA